MRGGRVISNGRPKTGASFASPTHSLFGEWLTYLGRSRAQGFLRVFVRMKTLLAIHASARLHRSITRRLTEDFVQGWKNRHPGAEVIQRDVGQHPPAAINEAWIAAAFNQEAPSPEDRRALAESETFIEELSRADAIVIGAPMYNFGMPAALKAYIDQIIRIGRTFNLHPERENPYEPLLSPKPVVLISSSGAGGYEAGGPCAGMNFLQPHLEVIFHFLGFTDLSGVHVGFEEFKDERWLRSIEQAEAALGITLERLTAHGRPQ